MLPHVTGARGTSRYKAGAWVFNGKTAEVLYKLDNPTPIAGGQFGWSLAKTDYNKDGRPDLYVGSSPQPASRSCGSSTSISPSADRRRRGRQPFQRSRIGFAWEGIWCGPPVRITKGALW